MFIYYKMELLIVALIVLALFFILNKKKEPFNIARLRSQENERRAQENERLRLMPAPPVPVSNKVAVEAVKALAEAAVTPTAQKKS